MRINAGFSRRILAAIDHSKILGIRAGFRSGHRFIGIWAVVVDGRVFARSWEQSAGGWYRTFLDDPRGTIQVGNRQLRIRAVRARGKRIRDGVERAYAAKYRTPGSLKYVRGFRTPRRRETTMEFLPRQWSGQQRKEHVVRRYAVLLAVGFGSLCFGALAAQTTVVTGDRSTPLRPLAGGGNVGVSNAVLRDQPEVRALRVVVDPGGTRVMHSHTDVKFHLFVPITGPMMLDLEGSQAVSVPPWQPYYMKAGTQHGFRNSGSAPVDIMEIFVR